MASRSRGASPRLLLVAFWVLPALVATLGLRLVPSRLNPDLSLTASLAAQLASWLPWVLWSQLIVAVGERVPLERGNVLRALLAHAVLSPLIVVAQILVIWGVSVAFGMAEPAGLESMVVIGIRQYGDVLVVIYWAVVAVHAGMRWHERWRQASVLSAQLREDVAQASLQALRAQLNPHFLFNALNSVVALIDRDPERARDMLVRIADLLRATLAASDDQETTLDAEVSLTARYLEIEQVRFADRLAVSWEIPQELRTCTVPAFALQPLVENALRHAVAKRRAPSRLVILARAVGSSLELVVRDDGADGPSEPAGDGAGIAIENLRARLRRLYGEQASFALVPRTTRGMDAIVRLPRVDAQGLPLGTVRTMTGGSAPVSGRRAPASSQNGHALDAT